MKPYTCDEDMSVRQWVFRSDQEGKRDGGGDGTQAPDEDHHRLEYVIFFWGGKTLQCLANADALLPLIGLA